MTQKEVNEYVKKGGDLCLTQKQLIKWCDNLESGKFKQGQDYLRHEYANRVTHCCLGVLGQCVFRLPSKELDDLTLLDAHTFKDGYLDKESTDQGNYAEANDGGATFKQIAKAIRKFHIKETK
jgi:hypothetical protein